MANLILALYLAAWAVLVVSTAAAWRAVSRAAAAAKNARKHSQAPFGS